MARPIQTYAMYSARIFDADDRLLIKYFGTLPAMRNECAKHFLDFDSTAAIRRYLDKNGVYAKGYQGVPAGPIITAPSFVHITPTEFPYFIE